MAAGHELTKNKRGSSPLQSLRRGQRIGHLDRHVAEARLVPEGSNLQLYLAQYGKFLLRKTYWNKKPMIAHGT
jgi:hypothetical protein